MKRLFDILFSSMGLLVFLPLFISIGLFIKLDSAGPVFYKQKRIGRQFVPFLIYKFRTMVRDADKKGLQITSGEDIRITRIGKFLRKTKIDELPQLINVLKGEMSFVGPRPEVEKYVELYKDDYKCILRVRPGITDISSIKFRDEERVLGNQDDPEDYYKSVLLPEKMKLAKKYIKEASFFYDLSLILSTIFRVIFPARNDEGRFYSK